MSGLTAMEMKSKAVNQFGQQLKAAPRDMGLKMLYYLFDLMNLFLLLLHLQLRRSCWIAGEPETDALSSAANSGGTEVDSDKSKL